MTSEAYRRNYLDIDWSIKAPAIEHKAQTTSGRGPTFVPDIKEFVSPIDGTVIGSRSALREHEKRHGVRQCGELKTPADFDNSPARREIGRSSDRQLERAFRAALERSGL